MYPYLPLLALIFVLSGCGRQSDTHDPADAERTPPGETATEAMEEPITPPEDSTATAEEQAAAPPTEAPVCTPEWFTWVHEQVIAMHDGEIAELYPAGLPEVGSEEWFLAVDKLTGGDGAHGPDGGSIEWCNMVQQRLSNSSQ